jgi:hypothetical protein
MADDRKQTAATRRLPDQCVSADQLRSAVAKVGPMVKNVREHLQQHRAGHLPRSGASGIALGVLKRLRSWRINVCGR